ncbi:50S ribosomal protein L25/general stress protein Ctc [Camelliibacillus cellulosilyticus]|uniref:Large ribosomal subunit protein bL25 n=1 Tax=Camelliibacillus cellulosilyticus TaxID=2174486 RepID=A0ABV9GUJ1_9BACL
MTNQLTGQERDTSRKSIAKRLRREGKIPAVIYGKNIENRPIDIDEADITRFFNESGKNGVLQLGINGKTMSVMAHDIQRDPLKGRLIHIDFIEVDMHHEIDVDVPIHTTGDSIGEKQGGVVQHHLNELSLRALPTKIPNVIEVDITNLDVGDSLTIGELKGHNDYDILNDDEEVVVTVTPPTLDHTLEEETEDDHPEAEETKNESSEDE